MADAASPEVRRYGPRKREGPLWCPLLEDRAQTDHVVMTRERSTIPERGFLWECQLSGDHHVRISGRRSRRCRGTQSGLHERRPAKMEVPNELRLFDDQDQGPAELNDPNTVQHFGGAG